MEIEAKEGCCEPFAQLGSIPRLTEAGTSVDAFALLTYFKLECKANRQTAYRMAKQGRGRNVHPTLPLLCHNFEAQDTILSEIHVPLYNFSFKKGQTVHPLAIQSHRLQRVKEITSADMN
jgi:hypothetical protein